MYEGTPLHILVEDGFLKSLKALAYIKTSQCGVTLLDRLA